MELRRREEIVMKNKWLYPIIAILFTCNITLLGLIYYKTNLVQRIGVKLGLIEMKPTDRTDYWCIMGWTNTLQKMNVDYDVVFFGNSITRGSSFHEYFPNVSICNLGYSGDNLDGMMLRVNQIKAVNAEKVFIMAGINGLRLQPLDVFENKYRDLIKMIKESNPEIEIFLQSILPVNHNISAIKYASNEKINEANNIIRIIADNNGCTYIDVHQLYLKDGELNPSLTTDGVHLKPEAYNEWATLLRPYIVDKAILSSK